MMATEHHVTLNGQGFSAFTGDTLLDAALRNGIELPHDCRAGHCGTCCVRLVAGSVDGGAGSEPGIVHACQCRIAAEAAFERETAVRRTRTVGGVVSSLRALSPEVLEVGISTERALPYLAGQYVKVAFEGYPSRPYSITHPLRDPHLAGRTTWFHIRRFNGGRVSSALGRQIVRGHRVTLSGPFGSAHFRPGLSGRMILVATNTGFAPIWSIAAAALRENPDRTLMMIVGGRTLEALYMGPALAQLARFPNVLLIPVCSRSPSLPPGVMSGRPTDFLPTLQTGDVVYACGAPPLVDDLRRIAAHHGAVCYADPFLPAVGDMVRDGVFTRAMGWLALPAKRPQRAPARGRREPHLAGMEGRDAELKQGLDT